MFSNPIRNIEYIFAFALLLGVFGRVGSNEATSLPEDDEWEEEEPEQSKVKVPEGMQTIKFHPANLTDEDQHSTHMPEDLRCDGCRVIAYLMTEKLKKTHMRKRTQKMSESDLIDILDQVCKDEDKKFEEYGIKEVDGKRRLSGEGLETKDTPGIMQGGGRWPSRLRQMCEQFVGDLGEEAIYESFLKSKSLESLFCHSNENGNICGPKKGKEKKKPSMKPKIRQKSMADKKPPMKKRSKDEL